MEEVSPVPAAAPESVGETLRAARERQGLSLGEVASRTRVPLRHLEAIEAGQYNALPSHTYATGFGRAYARAVGVDDVALTRRLRDELAHAGPRQAEYQPYEAPDPSRVPSRGLAIVSLGVALAIIVLIGLWYGGALNRAGTPAPVNVAAAPDTTATVPQPRPSPTAAPAPTGGQVTLQTSDRVWLRVHDGDKTLYLGTMSPGERFDIPADAANPLVDVGRPDQLRILLNGSVLPPLPASGRAMKDLRVAPAAVAARLNGTVAPLATPTPGAGPTPRDTSATTAPARPSRRALDETARANLEAARNPPSAAP